ncbi:unnamed protein product, partial [Iphiclides podalirius]
MFLRSTTSPRQPAPRQKPSAQPCRGEGKEIRESEVGVSRGGGGRGVCIDRPPGPNEVHLCYLVGRHVVVVGGKLRRRRQHRRREGARLRAEPGRGRTRTPLHAPAAAPIERHAAPGYATLQRSITRHATLARATPRYTTLSRASKR